MDPKWAAVYIGGFLILVGVVWLILIQARDWIEGHGVRPADTNVWDVIKDIIDKLPSGYLVPSLLVAAGVILVLAGAGALQIGGGSGGGNSSASPTPT